MRWSHLFGALIIGASGCAYDGEDESVGLSRAQLEGEEPIEVITGVSTLPDGRHWNRERSVYVEGDTVDRWTDDLGYVEGPGDFTEEEEEGREHVLAVRGSMRRSLKTLRDAVGDAARFQVVGWLAVRSPPPVDREHAEGDVAASLAEIDMLADAVQDIVDAHPGSVMLADGGTPMIHLDIDRPTLDDIAYSGLLDSLELEPNSAAHTVD